MAKTITPLFARVVVKPEAPEEVTASGIVLAESSNREKPVQGEVIAVGPDCKTLKGGETVLYKKYGPAEVTIDKADYLLIDEEDILGMIS